MPVLSNGYEDPENQQANGDSGATTESRRSPSSSEGEENEEYVVVSLTEIRKEVQCPICLGIIRKTRTVMECLHRFCRECIDKSMRLGNNECPACRTHCPSRRSLRDDPNYDALIAALYPDIDKYEEEELAFHEEEKARNRLIQESIAETFRRQAEALGRKRTAAKAFRVPFARRIQTRYRESHHRGTGRRSYRNGELRGCDETEDANIDPQRESSSAIGDAGGDENGQDPNREAMGAPAMLVGSSERLSWGRGGIRSHTRYGSASGNNGKNNRNGRLVRLTDYLKSIEENDDESQFGVYLMLLSMDQQMIPSLQQPYLYCRPTISVKNLCQYVAHHMTLQDSQLEICLVKELSSRPCNTATSSCAVSAPIKIDASKDVLRILEEQETLARIETCYLIHGHLILAYQNKKS